MERVNWLLWLGAAAIFAVLWYLGDLSPLIVVILIIAVPVLTHLSMTNLLLSDVLQRLESLAQEIRDTPPRIVIGKPTPAESAADRERLFREWNEREIKYQIAVFMSDSPAAEAVRNDWALRVAGDEYGSAAFKRYLEGMEAIRKSAVRTENAGATRYEPPPGDP